MAYLKAKSAYVGLGRNCLVLDVTSVVRWTGPPLGIIRAEQELVRYARARRSDVILAFHDPSVGRCTLRPEWEDTVLSPEGTIDPIRLARSKDGSRAFRRWRPSRYPIMAALERRRLTANSKLAARAAAALQWLLLFGWISHPFADERGGRVAVVPPSLALGAELMLEPGDTMVYLDWWDKSIDELAAEKRRYGFRCVALCYDLIPLRHPAFYFEHDVENFRRHWTGMFAFADRVIVNSHRVRSDVLTFCRANGIPIRELQVVPLGYDFQPVAGYSAARLPPGLESNHFALLVATIEQRKGHGLLLQIWRRLLAEGVPQRYRFKLVFVGRRGWKVDDLLRRLEEASGPGGMVVHFDHLPDADLATLYRHAAFCVLPSIVEGYGLPVIEAFSFGKAMLASNGGALPELVGDLSPMLDPTDEEAWYTALRRWIEDPAARSAYEARILASFSHPTWEQAAAQFFAAAANWP